MKFEEAKVVIDEIKGTSFIGMDTETVVDLRGGKKNPMKGRVTKRMIGANTMVSASGVSAYANMVKRRMEKEGKDPETFELKARPWGERLPNSPFIEHNGKYYLEAIFMSPGKIEYLLDGQPISKDEIQGLPEEKELTEEQKEKRQGGIEDEIIIRTFSLESIKRMRIKGTTIGD